MIDKQFYPTPKLLAVHAFHKFTDRKVKRLLEPEAGRGDLLEAVRGYSFEIDCIEIDLQNQAILRDKCYRVIDSDFMQFDGRGAMYSHILMNPPFNAGVKHTCKAWDILYEGEIVSILNANCVENPSTVEEKWLSLMIENHGSVEYREEMFNTVDTQRRTGVRIAIVHLVKQASSIEDFYIPFEDLKKDAEPDSPHAHNGKQIALPGSTISNLVVSFNVAVDKLRLANEAEQTADYYSRLIFTQIDPSKRPSLDDYKIEYEGFNRRYLKLKDMSWRAVMNTTDFSSKLSSKTQERLESEFEKVRDLEFTAHNIYGLLSGLIEQKGELDIQMMEEVFDIISRYHTENRAYYMGWKSNDKHRAGAYRIKMTRFILPVGNSEYGIDYRRKQEIFDIDKVFYMLDGKQGHGDEGSLFYLLNDRCRDLRSAERFHADYFDVRHYKGKGSLHIFPKRKDLVDRLNRIVGRRRRWLPDESESVDPRYWEIYKKAEKITAKMDIAMNKNRSAYMRSAYFDGDDETIDMDEVHANACDALGITRPNLLEDYRPSRKSLEQNK